MTTIAPSLAWLSLAALPQGPVGPAQGGQDRGGVVATQDEGGSEEHWSTLFLIAFFNPDLWRRLAMQGAEHTRRQGQQSADR
jgi:hypothetical protein